jgi:FkbM family methyltransferase
MNQPIRQPAKTIDFGSLHRLADARFEAMDSFDEIYFLGDYTPSFGLRAYPIAQALPNFAGIAVFSVSAEKRVRIAQQVPVRQNWRFIEMGELVDRAASKKILVVDFNDNLTGKNIAAKLATQGVTVRDYLFAMHQLGQVHTYQTVKEEREHVIANLAQFIALAERFDDEMSRRTLYARLEAMLTADRRPLIEVSYPLPDFINNFSTQAGLLVRDDDIFIDAGAAHGDTVSQFFQIARGEYRAIHAFEPDSKNYFALNRLCGYLPNAHAYCAGLGDKETEVDFFENPDNRFGSNFTGGAGAQKTTMKIMTIDSAVDEATLVKVDVEGWEKAVIQGGAKTIAKSKPDMTISAYHYAKDIPELLATVDEIARYKHVALRHYASTLYDTQLVFSDRQDFN